MKVAEVISTKVEQGRRIVKLRVMGKDDVQEVEYIQPFGIDSNPREDKRGLHTDTSSYEEKLFLGIANDNCAAEEGEIIVFSEDENGAISAYTHFKADGKIIMNGDADNAVRFKPMADSINELKDSVNDLKTIFTSWVTVPNDGGAALKAAAATWAGTFLVEDIGESKIDEIQVP